MIDYRLWNLMKSTTCMTCGVPYICRRIYVVPLKTYSTHPQWSFNQQHAKS